MKKVGLVRALISAGVAAAIVVLSPFAANAVEGEAPLDTSGLIEIEPGSSSAEADAQILAALEELEGKQSQEEIDALSELPYTHFLADDQGNYVAAVNTSPGISTFAITWLSPGCGSVGSDTGMCLKTWNGVHYGYVGTGIKNVSISGINNVTSGSYVGSVTTSSGNIYVLKAWQGVNFPIQKVTKITRG